MRVATLSVPLLAGFLLALAAGLPARAGSDVPPPRVVVGADDRVRITDTSVYPWSAIAFLEVYDAARQATDICTATFISPDALLTAAHCLYDPTFGRVDSIRVVPGKNQSLEPFGSQYAADWWVPDEWISSDGNSQYDWGLIKMPSGNLGTKAGWITVANLSTPTLSRADFTPAIVGYPGDKPRGSMWWSFKPAFVSVGPTQLKYDIDTAPGQSGSAIISASGGPSLLGYVVGIHTGADSFGGPNHGTRVDTWLLGDILDGCQVMGCAIAHFSEISQPAPTLTPTTTATPKATATATPAAGRAINFRWYQATPMGAGMLGCDRSSPVPPHSPEETGLCVVYDLTGVDGVHSLRTVLRRDGVVVADSSLLLDLSSTAGWQRAFPPPVLPGNYVLQIIVDGIVIGSGSVTVASASDAGAPAPTGTATPAPSWAPQATWGWNNSAWLGPAGSDINLALAALLIPEGAHVRAVWQFLAASQSWQRNLYLADGREDTQIKRANPGDVFWVLVAR